jgi:hypothetical protein
MAEGCKRPAAWLPIILLALALPSHSLAQPGSCSVSWSSPVRVSFDSVLSVSPHLAISGDTVHILWFGVDTIGGASHTGVQYARSTDGGVSFSSPATVASSSDAFNPGLLCSSGDFVWITYAGVAEGAFGTVLLRSTDAGTTWSLPRLLRGTSFPRLIASYGNDVCIHFGEQRTTASGILGSSDAGLTWEVRATNAPLLTDMQLTATQIHAVGEYDLGLHHEAGYYSSYDRGRSWAGPQPVSREDAAASTVPQVAVDEEETIYVVWNDTGAVTMRKSDGFNADDELMWGPTVLISETRGAIFPDIAAAGPFISVIWDNDFGGTGGIRLRPSNNSAETFCPVDDPTASGEANEPSVEIAGNILHTSWMESIGGAGEIIYRKGVLTRDLRPKTFALKQNYPNPFNGTTIIPYDLPFPSFVNLSVYNMLGQRVATLVNDFQVSARYEIPFPSGNLATGVYFYRLQTPGLRETMKFVIVR